MPGSPFSVWLVPAEPFRARLSAEIGGYADRYGAARFTPHVTLCAGTLDSEATDLTWQLALTDLVRGRAPLEGLVTGVDQTSHYFKTLYLELERGAALLALQAQASTAFGVHDYDFAPHLSLLYATLTEDERDELKRTAAPPPLIAFDALALVTPGPGGWNDVGGWRELFVCPFA